MYGPKNKDLGGQYRILQNEQFLLFIQEIYYGYDSEIMKAITVWTRSSNGEKRNIYKILVGKTLQNRIFWLSYANLNVYISSFFSYTNNDDSMQKDTQV